MIDCFLSALDRNPARIEFCRKTVAAMLQEPNIRLTMLDAGSDLEQLTWFERQGLNFVTHETKGSAHRRYELAENLATSDYFLLGDNDCVPISDNWLARALDVAKRHPQFGQFLFRLSNTDFFHHNFNDPEVRSVMWGGGLRLIKRGCRTAPFDWTMADDKAYCAAIRASGYINGMFNGLHVEHLGTQVSCFHNEKSIYE